MKPSVIAREFTKTEIEIFLRNLVPDSIEDDELIDYDYLFGGLSTTTILVTVGTRKAQYVLKIFYPNNAPYETFQNAMNVCEYIHRNRPDIPICHPVYGPDVRLVDGFPCILMNYISNAVAGDVAVEIEGLPRAKVLYAMGKVLGQLHTIKVSNDCTIDTYKTGGVVELYKHQTGEFLSTIRALKNDKFSDWYESERGLLSSVLCSNELRLGVVHGDPFMDNVMVHGDCSLAGLVDFEDSCIGPIMFDLGAVLAGSCFVDDTTIDWESVREFLLGYTENGELSANEKQFLFDFVAIALLCNCVFRYMTYHGSSNSDAYKDLYTKLCYWRSNENTIRQRLVHIV